MNLVSSSSKSLGMIAEQKRNVDDKKHIWNAYYVLKHCYMYLTSELMYVKQKSGWHTVVLCK